MPNGGRRAVRGYAAVLVTAPDIKTARRIASGCLKARVAACVNIVPRVESHYWWQGKVERGAELLLIIKTTRQRLAALEKCVLAAHPYDTPEFIVLPIAAGNRRYLEWISASCC
ncbi:MAG: divalent-cation tolerance protein CutA [Verrucomicrobia subdivision 3 bacterium]|nr:divalent-cation tolerance protein CutA [Limisphaerales bacterium]